MPGAPVQVAVPDVAFRAVADRPVILVTRGGQISGRILMVDPINVAVAVAPTGTVMVMPRAEIVELRLAQPGFVMPAPAPTMETSRNEPPPKPRHFALGLGIPPALSFDLDYRLFYAFGNLSLVFPAATGGGWVPFSLGFGLNFALARNSAWKMEVFAQVTPMYFENNWWTGVGVGIGFHYTWRSGFTLGFKLPVLGYSFTNKSYTQAGDSVAIYYLSYAMATPVAFVGYRF
jgi:hypothetical protein